MLEIFECQDIKVTFDEASGCMPAAIEAGGRRENIRMSLELQLGDGRVFSPVLPEDAEHLRYSIEDGERLDFPLLEWRGADGAMAEDFKLALRYEFDSSGAVFVRAFFYSETLNAPSVRSFKLIYDVDFKRFADVKWESFPRPASTNPTEVMLVFPERFIARGEDREYSGQLVSKVGFNAWGSQGDSLYMEYFVEGGGVLDCTTPSHTATRIHWNQDETARVEWDFLSEETHLTGRQWQWRNQWGFNLIAPRHDRTRPPFRMYHFFDAIKRYPTNAQLEKMARNGADVVVLHEAWRSDVQNDCFAYSPKELRRSIDKAHELGLRVALYTRGNEVSLAQENCPWFDALLKRDWDGLYMDYGSAYSEPSAASEWFPNGNFQFRKYVQRLHRLRRRVGEKGLLFSHTGPSFMALGQAPGLLDVYVSGEGEGGIMLKGRREHDYFACSMCGPGSMWTGAFPEYGTRRMLPFLAVAGQTPHAPIGIQFESSSLAHCTEPGMEDRYLRPLWKLWGLFKKQGAIRFYNHLNSALASSSLMTSAQGPALMILANFSDKPATVTESVTWDAYGIRPRLLELLTPSEETPGAFQPIPIANGTQEISVELPTYGIAGILINGDFLEAERKAFLHPYPEMDDADHAYLEGIARQKRLREGGMLPEKAYMQATIPAIYVTFEDSLVVDLYNNAHELGWLGDDGAFHSLGWLSKKGLVEARPSQRENLYVGDSTPWIELTPYKGRRLVIRTFHGNGAVPFYCFLRLELSPVAGKAPGAYTISFANELEPDRSLLHFTI